MSEIIFVDPEGIRENAGQIEGYANNIMDALNKISEAIKSTEDNYQSKAADEMREQFCQLKPTIEKFEAYLKKVVSYLRLNVAEPTSSVMATNVQNITNIRKPQ